MLINGVETIQGGPKRDSAWSRNSPDYNGLALRMKPACVKARVARKSRGQQCPYGFDSRPEHINSPSRYLGGLFLLICSEFAPEGADFLKKRQSDLIFMPLICIYYCAAPP